MHQKYIKEQKSDHNVKVMAAGAANLVCPIDHNLFTILVSCSSVKYGLEDDCFCNILTVQWTLVNEKVRNMGRSIFVKG